MLSKSLISILALTSMVSASPALRRQTQSTDQCQDAYKSCVAAGTPEVACSCTLTACVGEDNGRNQEFCSSATANLGASKTSGAPAASSSASGCRAGYLQCLNTKGADGLSSNKAQCASDNAGCQGGCYAAYNNCRTTRGPDGLSANQAQCVGEFAECLGENPVASTGGIISSFIPATATASVQATTTTVAAAATSSAAAGGCKAAHDKCLTSKGADGLSSNKAQCASENADCQGKCYASYNTCRTTRGPDGLSANMAQCASEYAQCLGENPIASTGGLISSFLPYTATASTMATSVASAAGSAAPKVTAVSNAAAGSNPKKVDGKTWTLNNVYRDCSKGSTCNYNFDIVANGKTENCAIKDASKQSFTNVKCANDDFTVTWGYVANPAPAFAVITVVDKQNELAWFGVDDVNSKSSWGNLPAQQVYTYN